MLRTGVMNVLQFNALDTVVSRVEDVNQAAAVARQGPGVEQFARRAAVAAPVAERAPVDREFLHAMVTVLGHVHVALAIERQPIRV